MPFIPNHLSTEEVEAVYLQALKEIELCEVRGWVKRLVDPAAEPALLEITKAREALERDLALSREQWSKNEGG